MWCKVMAVELEEYTASLTIPPCLSSGIVSSLVISFRPPPSFNALRPTIAHSSSWALVVTMGVNYSVYLVTDSTSAILGSEDLLDVVEQAIQGGSRLASSALALL